VTGETATATVTTADATVKTNTVTTTTVANAVAFWRLVKRYIGGGFKGLLGRGLGSRRRAVDTPTALGEFIHTRASHVAQTALYGYMKTRAGTRFPALFEDPAMLSSINIAKWHVWAACVSDLAVYSGALLRIHGGASAAAARAVIVPLVAHLATTNRPSPRARARWCTGRRLPTNSKRATAKSCAIRSGFAGMKCAATCAGDCARRRFSRPPRPPPRPRWRPPMRRRLRKIIRRRRTKHDPPPPKPAASR